MRIEFQRSGGFAGLRLATTVDVDKLPADEAAELKRLVDAADFFRLPATLKATRGADQFTYRLTVEAGNRQHTVEVSENAAPESLRPLLQRLATLARTAPRSSS
jgi:hypothetical protein